MKKNKIKKEHSYIDILNNPEGRKIIDAIEDLDVNKKYLRDGKTPDHLADYNSYKKELKKKFNYTYRSSKWDD